MHFAIKLGQLNECLTIVVVLFGCLIAFGSFSILFANSFNVGLCFDPYDAMAIIVVSYIVIPKINKKS